eukprot:1563137-Lingulodinium_polyedra.AAC.1
MCLSFEVSDRAAIWLSSSEVSILNVMGLAGTALKSLTVGFCCAPSLTTGICVRCASFSSSTP